MISGLLFLVLIAQAMACLKAKVSITEAEGLGLTGRNFHSGELIFDENFQTLDEDVWLREPLNSGHLEEFQLYTFTDKNSYAQNGVLHIKPTLFDDGDADDVHLQTLRENFYPIRSARLSTKNSFSFKYGTVEFRAKIPSGDWLFPALWLMPKNSEYGTWPMSGEVDIMESRGNKDLNNTIGEPVGVQNVCSTLHWGPNRTLDRWRLTHYEKIDQRGFNEIFHTYKLIWSPQRMSFYVDNEEIGGVDVPETGFWNMGDFDGLPNLWSNGTGSAPFDIQFYLIINLAVGGKSFFSDSCINKGGKPWNNLSPNASLEFWEGRDQWLPTWNIHTDDSHLLVDYVKVWAL